MARLEKTGDWDKVTKLIENLQEEMIKSQMIALKRWGLLAEGLAVRHISRQDLGWVPLKASTLTGKIRSGYSEDILVRTSTYFQSITSYVKDEVVYAGVRKTAKGSDGEVIADIAAVHEFGSQSANIPARPLWQPTFEETVKRITKDDNLDPVQILLKRLKKYL